MFTPLSEQLWYEEPRTPILESIGGKALGLSSIAAARLPTPPAIIIPTDVYRASLHETRVFNILTSVRGGTQIPLDYVRREFESLDLSDSFTAALYTATSHLTAPFAVRSSAVVEDAPTSSWAGQFLTILGVQTSGLARSLVRCWSSIFTAPVASYASVNNLDLRQIYMAVVIQEMISPIWAGVLFTGINLKRQKNSNSVLFEAVRGLGEKLVSGAIGPEVRAEARLSDFGIRSREIRRSSDARRMHHPDESSKIPDLVISELARGASKLQEIHDQEFLDIEWAWDGQVPWFLQARPLVSQ
jgi:phosphoenolpyruvate synthase/pyruvate phosphate dikinase